MPVRGDLGKLRDLSAKMRTLPDGKHLEAAAERIRGTVLKLSADQFKAEQDPYGNKWAPLKRERMRNRKTRLRLEKRLKKLERIESLNHDSFMETAKIRKKLAGGGSKIGQDTGRMRASLSVQVEGRRVIIAYPVEYSGFFHGGTRHQKARHLVPTAAAGLGPIWEKAIARDVQEALAAALGMR